MKQRLQEIIADFKDELTEINRLATNACGSRDDSFDAIGQIMHLSDEYALNDNVFDEIAKIMDFLEVTENAVQEQETA